MNLSHALKWSFLAEIASKTITPIVFLFLARLLTPEDFGVVSAATMVIAFSQIFWEAGMSKALIQRQTDISEAANVAFWVNIALGCMIASLLFLSAGPIAMTFFKDARVTAVLQVMTLQVMFGALSSVQTALLQKEMGFKKLFWVRMITVTFPGIASIPLAWSGFAYWSLVTGTLTGQIVQVFMLWQLSHWRPSWHFHAAVAKEMVMFGAWVGVSGVLAWFYTWADSLIVGKYLGTHDLGLYRTGNQFVILVFNMIFGPIMPVLYSYLSRMEQDQQRLKIAIEKVIRIIILISVPIAIILFTFSSLIGLAVFDSKWDGLGIVIGVMALVHGFSWIVGMNGEVYRAMGKPSYETVVPALTLFLYLAAYTYTIQIGFNVFIWNRLLLALGALLFHLYILKIIIKVNVLILMAYLCGVTIAAFFSVSIVHWLTISYFSGVWLPLLAGSLTSVVLLGLIIYIFERNRMIMEIILFAKTC
jgi:PST family polysaccharide transporter